MSELETNQGEFRLLHKIGEGGMADVYLAERLGDDGFRTRVALKRLHRGLAMDSYFIRQLVREARLLGQLEHVNIVKVFDLRNIGDEYYVVMEYVDGIDLAAVVKVHRSRKTRIPRPFFFHVALSLTEALAYAHQAVDAEGRSTPLVHRDIKPSNVMLSRRGVVKLTDFGIAHVGDGSVTDGLVQGTANYMSPEQAFGEERLTPASDVYSLGSVFYELLTGKPLVDGDNYLKAIHQVRQRVVSLEELATQGVEPGLRMVTAKMLAPDLADRYIDMESVRNDLQFVAERLEIDLSWPRIRAYVSRLMGILGRAPDRATLTNLPEVSALAEEKMLLKSSAPSAPPAPPSAEHLSREGSGPVTRAVQKDLLTGPPSRVRAAAGGQGQISVATDETPTEPPTRGGRHARGHEKPSVPSSGQWADEESTQVYAGRTAREMGVLGTTELGRDLVDAAQKAKPAALKTPSQESAMAPEEEELWVFDELEDENSLTAEIPEATPPRDSVSVKRRRKRTSHKPRQLVAAAIFVAVTALLCGVLLVVAARNDLLGLGQLDAGVGLAAEYRNATKQGEPLVAVARGQRVA